MQALLARGQRARAIVRSLAERAKTARLAALPGLELAAADVRDEAQRRAAMDGVDMLFHVAAAYALAEPGRDAEILAAATRGTEASLRAPSTTGARGGD